MTYNLFVALLLAASKYPVAELREWASKVVSDKLRTEGLRQAWKPLTTRVLLWHEGQRVTALGAVEQRLQPLVARSEA